MKEQPVETIPKDRKILWMPEGDRMKVFVFFEVETTIEVNSPEFVEMSDEIAEKHLDNQIATLLPPLPEGSKVTVHGWDVMK